MEGVVIRCPEGGVTQTPLADHFMGVLKFLLLVLLLDMILKCTSLFKTNSKARWFGLHSAVNWLITIFAFSDSVSCLSSPLCSMVQDMDSWYPSHLAFALHVYHFLAYTNLRAEDIVHPVLFVGTFAVVNFLMSWGKIANLLLFFMTGIPGAIDYALLALVKLGKFNRLEEKRVNAHINIWLRSPGLIVVAVIMFVCLSHRAVAVHPMAAALTIVLCFGNGVYYGQQVVRNYEREFAILVYNKSNEVVYEKAVARLKKQEGEVMEEAKARRQQSKNRD